MKVWTIANQKGGVGKTTSTVTLGGLLAKRGNRTLLVDMDPHGSLTAYFGLDPDKIQGSVYNLFDHKKSKKVIDPQTVLKHTNFENLSFLPASTAMATLDRQLGTQDGMGLVLTEALQKVSSQFDYVLIDCPPVLGVLMVNALAVCEKLIVPVQTEFLALKGLERMIRTVTMIMSAKKTPMSYVIVPTIFDKRTNAALRSLEELRMRYQDKLWDDVIPIDTQFREASAKGIPLSLMMSGSRGSKAYANLLDSLVESGATYTESESQTESVMAT